MVDREMNEAFAELRAALDQIEVGAVQLEHSGASVQSLGRAVDNLRTKVWVYLTTHRAGDVNQYLGEVRVLRATEICTDLLSDLRAGAIPKNTPGIDLLRGTLRELRKACKITKA